MSHNITKYIIREWSAEEAIDLNIPERYYYVLSDYPLQLSKKQYDRLEIILNAYSDNLDYVNNIIERDNMHMFTLSTSIHSDTVRRKYPNISFEYIPESSPEPETNYTHMPKPEEDYFNKNGTSYDNETYTYSDESEELDAVDLESEDDFADNYETIQVDDALIHAEKFKDPDGFLKNMENNEQLSNDYARRFNVGRSYYYTIKPEVINQCGNTVYIIKFILLNSGDKVSGFSWKDNDDINKSVLNFIVPHLIFRDMLHDRHFSKTKNIIKKKNTLKTKYADVFKKAIEVEKIWREQIENDKIGSRTIPLDWRSIPAGVY